MRAALHLLLYGLPEMLGGEVAGHSDFVAYGVAVDVVAAAEVEPRQRHSDVLAHANHLLCHAVKNQ